MVTLSQLNVVWLPLPESPQSVATVTWRDRSSPGHAGEFTSVSATQIRTWTNNDPVSQIWCAKGGLIQQMNSYRRINDIKMT